MSYKKALITGITGQDGAYLAEFLIKKGYMVHGIKRRTSLINTERIDHLYQDPHEGNRNLILHYGDLTDSMNLTRIIQEVQPDEIYNLAAMSHVKVSFDTPEYTANADGIGMLRILEAVRLLNLVEKTRIYQASTSELFGLVQQVPQTESTPFYPRSPYGIAKLYAYWITVNYREAYHLHASNGILFNHESPIRGETFVTRKITRALARIAFNMQQTLYVGNLSAKRDWGHAKDYVRAMYLILQQDKADDYVIATGITTSIRDFIKMTAEEMGLEISFLGKGAEEKGYLTNIDDQKFIDIVGLEYLDRIKKRILRRKAVSNEVEPVIAVDPNYFRPTEVELLIGDASKARNVLKWEPEYSLAGLVQDMILSDLKLAQKDAFLKNAGYNVFNYFE
ncbi:MAG: GDP-mannose 4,6-dehydratase [Draconibacterium sp.]